MRAMAEARGARIDGKEVARAVREEVARDVVLLRARGVVPGLAVILVGNDPASEVYVRNKDRAAAEAGFSVRTVRLSAQASPTELATRIEELNRDPQVHGILIQLPLPRGLDGDAAIRALDPDKDVDGLHPRNVAALWRGEGGFVPCTPAGCIELLERRSVELEGAHAVVIGRSQLVGKPLAALLLARNATVTVCHSRTRDLPLVTREADVLVAAVGRPRLVKRDWVKPGAVVLDVGINRLADGTLAGDVDYEEVADVASAITPVPGGVGPMTIAMLLRNTLSAARSRAGLNPGELGVRRV
jgi:methylenetetrahydrofolate dehydrogenase (NADP+)/methenyltetrahydrofolate cyclohydrolase